MGDRIRVEVEESLLPLVPVFLENRRRDLETIEAALGAGDLEPVIRVGHNMKGAGGGYGFDAISELGAELESAAHAGDAGAIRRLHEALEQYLARVEVVPGEG